MGLTPCFIILATAIAITLICVAQIRDRLDIIHNELVQIEISVRR